MTETDFYAPDAATPDQLGRSGGHLPRPRRRAVRIPDLCAPTAVGDTWRKLRAYSMERRSLGEQPHTPSSDRRIAALALVVGDCTDELHALVADTRDEWAAALDTHNTEAHQTYANAVDQLDTARTDMVAAGMVLAWIDSADQRGQFFRQFHTHPGPKLGEHPWHVLANALRVEAGLDTREPDHPERVEVFSTVLRNLTAHLPALAQPEPLAQPYAEHREQLAQHRALGVERRQLEDTRATAVRDDQRALADAIAQDKPDPGDKAQAALDAQILQVDLQRARLLDDIRDSHAEVLLLFRQHQAKWRADVAQLHRDALARYETAAASLPAARLDLHHGRKVAEWLATTTPDNLGQWTDTGRVRLQLNLLGMSFDMVTQLIRDDITPQAQLAARAAA